MTAVRILIVEDEVIIALSLQRKLENAGYDVPAVASSGSEAVQLALQLQPDLMLVDISLGEEMSGIDIVTQIRPHLDIPIIYLTAYSDDDILQLTQATHPAGHLLKPIEDEQLYTAIETALKNYKT